MPGNYGYPSVVDDSDAVDNTYNSDGESATQLKTNSYKMKIFWVSFLDGQQRVVIFTRDSRVADAARMVGFSPSFV